MIWLIFILIYLVSFSTHILLVYLTGKRHIYTVGDIIDEIDFLMWFPIINTIVLISFGVVFIIVKIVNLLKLSVWWEKFRNIKLK